jgi:hypothetical protein
MRVGQILSETGYGMVDAQELANRARVERTNQIALDRLRRQEQAALDFARQGQIAPVGAPQRIDMPTVSTLPVIPAGAAPAPVPAARPAVTTAPAAPVTPPTTVAPAAPAPAPTPAPTAAAAPAGLRLSGESVKKRFEELPRYVGEEAGIPGAEITSFFKSRIRGDVRVDPVTGGPVSFGEFMRLEDERSAADARTAAPAAPKPAAPKPAARTAPTTSPLVTAPVAQQAPAIAQAAQDMKNPEFYLGNPNAIPAGMQQTIEQAELLTQRRNQIAQLANMYLQMATPESLTQFATLQNDVFQMDVLKLQYQHNMDYLEGMQGLQELEMANDPRRLASVWSRFSGVPVGIQPRSDGTYDLIVNGKTTAQGVSAADIGRKAQLSFSEDARKQVADLAAITAKLSVEAMYEQQTEITKATLKAAGDIQLAIVNGEYKLAEKLAEQRKGKLTIDTNTGGAWFTEGDRVYFITPGGITDTKTGMRLPPAGREVQFPR